MDYRRPVLDRWRFLTCACTAVAGTVAASGSGSAAVGGGDLTIEVVRHRSVDPNDDAIGTVLEGVELFAETWTDATPGTADVTMDEFSVATFEESPSHGDTLDAIETDDGLRSDRTPETVTLFVIEDGTTTAGAMRAYAGHATEANTRRPARTATSIPNSSTCSAGDSARRVNSFGTSRHTSAGTQSSAGQTFRTIRPTSPTAIAHR